MPGTTPKNRRPLLAAAVVAGFALATSVSAQDSTTRGFVLGGHIGLGSVGFEDTERSSGGGAGLMVGYGLNRTFTIFALLDGSTVDVRNQPDVEGTWAIGHADLGVRFNFANSLRSWVPYLQGSVGIRAVSVTDIPAASPISGQDVSLSGGSLTFGGGFMLYAAESFAFDIGALFSGGNFTTLTVDGLSESGFDVKASSSRFNLGVVWWP
jgi:hypothetical protein